MELIARVRQYRHVIYRIYVKSELVSQILCSF